MTRALSNDEFKQAHADRLGDTYAYLMKYGNQPVESIDRMTRWKADFLGDALNRLVERENKPA